MRTRFIAAAFFAIAATAITVTGLALPPPATIPVIATSTLPPPPTPLPQMRLPGRGVFAAPDASGATTVGQNANGSATATMDLSFGVVGVYIDGANSSASILEPTGETKVTLGAEFHGHRVVDITMDGVTLDDGSRITRGLGVNNGTGEEVPAIVATGSPAPSPEPTPTPPTFGAQQPTNGIHTISPFSTATEKP